MKLTYEEHFMSHRPDGRFVTHLGALMERLRHENPLLRLPDDITAQTYPAWREQVIEKLKEVYQMPEREAQPAPVLLSCEKREGYRLEKWEMYPDAYSAVPFLLLVPDSAGEDSRVPAVLCQPGAQTSKEWLAGEAAPNHVRTWTKYPERNHMAVHYVKNGMVALALDNPGTGECGLGDGLYPSHTKLVDGYLFTGTSYFAVVTSQMMLALDFLRTLPYVDADRLAVSGHSLGTIPSLCLGLLRDDVKAVVFNDFVSSPIHRYYATTEVESDVIHQFSTVWAMIPGMWKWFGHDDLLAALAPKYLAVNEGGPISVLDRIHLGYRLAGAEDHLQITHYPKYQDPAMRLYDDEHELPKYGLSGEDYFAHCNVDAPDHSFRAEPSVKLLKKCFSL